LKAQGDQASTTPLGATAPAMEKESQDALQNRLAELEAQMTRLLTENDRLRISLADVQKNQTAAPTVDGLTDGNLRGIDQQLVQDKMAMFEAKLTQLENENDRLRADLTALQSTGGPVIDLSGGSSSSEQEEPALKIVSDKTVLGEKIILDDQPKDDLTKIEGLGPFLEGKLNEIGVFTYEEIASWTPAREEEVTLLIGHLPGRIAKDQWVAQAAQLAAAKETSSTVERQAAPIMPEGEMPFGAIQQTPTDLKLIEGIGPKIEEILKANEIHNWSELAGTDPGRLREILEAAGDQYRMHNPYTWPLQARLAAAGRWEELKEYQEELKGGREVTD
ncbi:MAG: hypothetical protein KDC54_05065, partial [Lewinella sp.]|nr:hypothetical protein [Lewinella sp.]